MYRGKGEQLAKCSPNTTREVVNKEAIPAAMHSSWPNAET